MGIRYPETSEQKSRAYKVNIHQGRKANVRRGWSERSKEHTGKGWESEGNHSGHRTSTYIADRSEGLLVDEFLRDAVQI